MKIGVLGTGMVGQAIAGRLVELGHEVKMGSRDAANKAAAEWKAKAGGKASVGTFSDAAAFGETVFNCTNGAGALDALKAAGAANLSGKVLVDVSNPLDFSQGMPPTLLVSGRDSLAEQIQKAFPAARVVKAFNTLNADLMVHPERLPGEHLLPICGNDAAAKQAVTTIAKDWFGWKSVVDVGDLTAARGTESYVLFWVRLYMSLGSPEFNVALVRPAK